MNFIQTRNASVYLFLLIQTVSGKVILANLNLTQVPVSEIDTAETRIDLSRNLISRVDDNTFVLFPRLTELELYRNQISFLSDLAFNGTSIISLNMEFNKLTALPRFASIGSSLQNLNVGHNLIERAGEDEFRRVTGLRELSMGFNRLNYVHPQAFSDFASTIYYLGLRTNPNLTSIPGEIFSRMGQLHTLNILQTSLTSFPDFRHLPDNNRLIQLWISSVPWITSRLIGDLEDNALYKLGKMKYFIAGRLGLTKVPDFSRQIGDLLYLHLDSNFISDIPNNAFDNLPLQTLNLRYNRLTRLPNIQSVQSTLTKLDLGHNNFRTLACEDIHDMIVNYPLLDRVDFSYTNIETFPDILQLNRSFREICILNPITMRCDCAMEWMIGLEDRMRTDIEGTSKPCAAPPRLAGREWSKINRMDLCQDNAAVSCHSNPPLLPTFSTSAPGLLTSAIDTMAMTSQDHHDMTRMHLIGDSSSSVIPPTKDLADETGGVNILAAALGGALGVVLIILVIVVVVLVCRMRSSSSSNQSGDNKQEGEENDAYLKIGDGNRTYVESASPYTELTERTTKPNKGGVYDEIDELALGPVTNGAQGNNSAGRAEVVTGGIPVYKNVIKSDATNAVYQNVK